MNKKKKIQLVILCGLFLAAVAAFAALKISQENVSEEEEAETWQVVSAEVSEVKEISIISPEGNLDLSRESGEWRCLEEEDAQIDGSLVDVFLEDVGAITSETKIENVEDFSQYGFDAPQITVTLQWDDNMYVLKLGDYNSMITGYYINVNDEPVVYVVDSSVYYTLNKSLENFKKMDAGE